MTDGPICIKCLAEQVAGNVLGIFAEEHPEIAMNYLTWHDLGATIEAEIKEALGYEEPEGEHPDHPTVQ